MLALPEEICIMILYEFLNLKECGLFDIAICNKKYRQILLNIFTKLPPLNKIIYFDNIINWISLRKLKIKTLIIDDILFKQNIFKIDLRHLETIQLYVISKANVYNTIKITNSYNNIINLYLYNYTDTINEIFEYIMPSFLLNLKTIFFYKYPPENIMNKINTYCNNITFIFMGTDFEEYYMGNNLVLFMFIEKNINIKNIILWITFFNDNLIKIINKFKHLEHIELISPFNMEDILYIINNNPNLKIFNVGVISRDSPWITYNKNIDICLFNYSEYYGDIQNYKISSSFIDCRLINLNTLTDDILIYLLSKSHESLKVLMIDKCDLISKDAIRNILFSCNNLIKIHLKCVDKEEIYYIFENIILHQVEILYIDCDNLLVIDIVNIIDICPKLIELYLNKSSFINSEILSKFIDKNIKVNCMENNKGHLFIKTY